MKITLTERDIHAALISYLVSQGINVEGKNADINIIAGRKGNGLRADIDLTEDDSNSEPVIISEEVEESREVPVLKEAVEEAIETPESLFSLNG